MSQQRICSLRVWIAAISGRNAASSSAGTSALTRLQKLSVLHLGNRPPMDFTKPRIALVTNGFEQLRVEACQARENLCVTAVVLAIVLIDLAHLARVSDDDFVTIGLDQTADPTRVGTGFQRHARRREAR